MLNGITKQRCSCLGYYFVFTFLIGVVFTGLDFEYSVPDDVSFGPLSIDAVASTEPYSRAVSGEDLWKLEVFASSDPEGKIKTDSFLKKVNKV